MSELSVRLASAASGLYMAVRSAFETDDGENDRVIERVDFASGKFVSPMTFPKRGHLRTLAYTSGGTHEVLVGDTLTGATSGATARVVSLTLTSGTWAEGDAAGTLTLCDQIGTLQSENLNEGENNDVCTVAGNSAASTLTAADTFDLTALPAGLTQNLLTVGDKSLLVVAVEQYTSAGTITVTPIIFDDESTPGIVGILPARTFIQPYAFRRGSASGLYVLPVQSWDIVGAYKIGLHMSAITGASNYPYIYGWVI
jgi:hypothetical protein